MGPLGRLLHRDSRRDARHIVPHRLTEGTGVGTKKDHRTVAGGGVGTGASLLCMAITGTELSTGRPPTPGRGGGAVGRVRDDACRPGVGTFVF